MTPPESCKVYTPPDLARAMVRVLPDGRDASWLEPCAGSGVFLQALSESGVPQERIRALDLDRNETPADKFARTIRRKDFLAWARVTDERFDRVVANPPYLSINKLEASLRESAVLHRAPDGNQVALGSNYWYAFLCACLGLLNKGASISFVLPASWDYADYARPLRNTLPKLFRTVVIHRSRRPLFESVQEGSVVLVASDYGQGRGSVLRREHADRRQLIASLQKSAESIRFCVGPSELPKQSEDSPTRVRFDSVLTLRLGGVTGDSKYFLLTEAERLERDLPVASLRPVLSRARHLTGPVITRHDWAQLRERGERVWLFCPPPSMCEHPAVKAYLSLGPEEGGCKKSGYKVSRREPWYRTPLPSHCHGFLSGMSKFGPWIALNSMKGLNATNTLYVVRFRGAANDNERHGLALSLLTTGVREQLRAKCRVYADGLPKFEPGDLNALLLPKISDTADAKSTYEIAIEALLNGDSGRAQALADAFFCT